VSRAQKEVASVFLKERNEITMIFNFLSLSLFFLSGFHGKNKESIFGLKREENIFTSGHKAIKGGGNVSYFRVFFTEKRC
jgi:hypothetical protein